MAPLSIMVVGADGLVGSGLVQRCLEAGHRVLGTCRRSPGPDRMFLDLAVENPRIHLDRKIDVAFIAASYASYERCETDPVSEITNVINTPLIVEQLLKEGVFVLFLSSNTVFGGERLLCGENDAPSPVIAYSRQKAQGEAGVMAAARRLGAADRLSITRLTKIVTATTPPLHDWFPKLRAGQPIHPFADLLFSPLSLEYVVKNVRTIGENRIGGFFHLSGVGTVSYVEFAEKLVDAMNWPRTLIQPTTATEKGVRILFKPTHSALGMTRTTQTFGIQPQPLQQVVEHLANLESKK